MKQGIQTFLLAISIVLTMGFVAGLQASEDGCAERCGHEGRKSLFCHVPPGNPNNPQEICIDDRAVPKHLEEHGGDHCGTCEFECEEIVCCPDETPTAIAELSLQKGKIVCEDSDGDWGRLCCEPDTDGDGQCGDNDDCPNDPDKTEAGICGCGVSDVDSDEDGTADCDDDCDDDAGKTNPGICGCGTADTDSDGDGIPDCNDVCPEQPNVDSDEDGTLDCLELCPHDPSKTEPGICGCGVADVDADADGVLNCNDNCPVDPNKINAGLCGCGVADVDDNGNGIPDCNEDAELAGKPDEPTGPAAGEGRNFGGGFGCSLIRE